MTDLAVLSTWLNPAFGVALILPGLVPHFFTGGALGLVFIALIAPAILALGWVCQRKLVDVHWDPTPHRPSPTSNADAAATSGATGAATSSGTATKYPKVLPPEGAPVPPARIDH